MFDTTLCALPEINSAKMEAMETRQGSLLFGGEANASFRLSVRIDVQGHRNLTLYRNNVPVPDMLSTSLALLQFFLENPQEKLLQSTIQKALSLNAFDKNLSNLRSGLDRDDHHNPRFIQTFPNGEGYMFLLEVTREGELGTELFPTWRPSIFHEVLEGVTHNPSDEEDLRIVTIAFSGGVQEMRLDLLLKRNARIRIVMTDPDAHYLLEARHGLRQDGMNAEEGRNEIRRQIEALERIAALPAKMKNCTGFLELTLSDAMPSSFIAHTRKRAVAGIFLAGYSNTHGPMMEVYRDTEPWNKLYEDWQLRWIDAQSNYAKDVRSPRLSLPLTTGK